MFLTNFLEWASGDETPENYNAWAALSALGSIVGRKVWLMNGRFMVLPNLYVVLLGPPGNAKTTAMKRAQKVVRHFGPEIPFSADCQTKESICKEMPAGEKSLQVNGDVIPWTPYSMFITELSHLLGGQHQSMHMIDFLTTIYDKAPEDYDAKTKNKGNDSIKCPLLNLLACTTPEWVTLYLKQDIISGGFTRRALFINEEWSHKRIPRPVESPAQTAAFNRCLLEAEEIFEAKGELVWHPDTARLYDEWYVSLDIPQDLDVRSFHKSKHNQVLKIGILVATATHPHDLVFLPSDFETAVGIVDSIGAKLGAVFRGMGRNELKHVIHKALDLLEGSVKGEMKEKQFRTALYAHAKAAEIEEVVNEMLRSNQIYMIIRDPGTKAAMKYVLLPARYEELKKKEEIQ